MSKAKLLAELRRLRGLIAQDDALRRTIHELEVQREEVGAQQAKLIESQRLLEASRDEYVNLFDFAPIGYAILDANGVLQDINLTGARLFETERTRAIGYPFQTFVTDRRALIDCLARCRRNGQAVEMEITLGTRGDRRVPVQLTIKPSTDRTSDALVFYVAIVDLTAQKRVEEDRLRAEEERRRLEQEERLARAAAEAKDHFLAVLSHELRTPLTPILFAIASLRRAADVPPALTSSLDIIDRNVKLEARLIDDLLDVTRIAQRKLGLTLATVDAHVVVEEVVALCSEEIATAGVQLSLDLGAATHHVRGDETRLRQVVWNLLNNALHYTPREGRVTVRSANGASGRLVLEVRDNGEGIPRDVLDRIFRPFEQYGAAGRASGGLGLGLSICKGIVEGHGGTIAAASDGPGMGASFTVELPTVSAPAPAARTGHEVRERAEQTRILLVDDNPDNAASMADLLQAIGYDVTVAGSVQAALCAAEKGFDVLVSDIGLPDGTGRDLMRALRARGPVRGIALTGYGTNEDISLNADAGFARHLTKPVDPQELVAAIDELVHIPPRVRRSDTASARPRSA